MIFIKNKHTLIIDDFIFKCSLGKKGLSHNKKEGDKKTPIGKYSMKIYIIGKIEFKNLILI